MLEIINVKNLKKSYKSITAVNEISFKVFKGTIYGLLGHNGAGKSTTLECILGTKDVTSGEVSILSQNPLNNRKQLFQRVGVQFQDAAYQDRIKVKEICEINQSLYKNARNYKEMLKEFNLINKLNSFVAELSGGERQKLYIILATMHNPEVIFLDELTTGLDPKARREIWAYILKLKEQGATIFLTSHYMDEVEHLCDYISILKHGEIIISGSVEEVVNKSGKANMDEAFLYFSEEEA